jgi:20S proteasome alpha/beta subunit
MWISTSEHPSDYFGCYLIPVDRGWDMTLALAMAGKDHVVVVADTLAHTQDPGAIYRRKIRKMYAVNNGTWGVAVAGSHHAIDLVKNLNGPKKFAFSGYPDTDADNYLRALSAARVEYGHDGNQMWFLLIGLDKKFRPFIYLLDLQPGKLGYATELSDHNAIGVANHGGLYFVHEYHHQEMSATDRISLGHFCLSEVAKQEVRIDPPFDIGFVDRTGFICFEDSEIPSVITRSNEIAAMIRSQFTGRMPLLDLEALRRSKHDPSGEKGG